MMLDACLMAQGSWIMAHGQGRPGEAHRSWPGASPTPGPKGRRGRTWDLRPSVQMWDAATTSVLATAIDSVAEEAQLAASQDARARASETERAVWDALPLFTFGSCRLNKVAGNDQQYYELLLTYYAEDAATKMAAVHCCRFAVTM